MAQRTIIIESNKRGSNLNALNETDNPLTLNDDNNFNYKWNTSIDNIEIEVGDEIQVEACAINVVGAVDGMLEITGQETEYGLVDNTFELEYGYYINDLWNFNYPLPMVSTTIINPAAEGGEYNFNNIWNIGEVDFYGSVAKFQASRPIEKIEIDVSATKTSLNTPTRRRVYLSDNKSYFNGFYANRPSPNTAGNVGRGRKNVDTGQDLFPKLEFYPDSADFKIRKSKTNITITPGFVNAGSLGEEITAQLHTDQRSGVDAASDPNDENFAEFNTPYQFKVNPSDATKPIYALAPSVQSNTYKTLGTQPILNTYADGIINNVVNPELSYGIAPGNAKAELIYRYMFYKDLMSPEPARMCLYSNLSRIANNNPVCSNFDPTIAGGGPHNLKKFSFDLFDNVKYPAITNAAANANPEINNIKTEDFNALDAWTLYTGGDGDFPGNPGWDAPYDMISNFGPCVCLMNAECGGLKTGGTGGSPTEIGLGEREKPTTASRFATGYYTSLPQYYVLQTNIFYNEKNFKLLKGTETGQSLTNTKGCWFETELCNTVNTKNSLNMENYNPNNLNNQGIDDFNNTSLFFQELDIGRTNDQLFNPFNVFEAPDETGSKFRISNCGLPSYNDAWRSRNAIDGVYDYSNMYSNAVKQSVQKIRVYSRWNEKLNPQNNFLVIDDFIKTDKDGVYPSCDLSRRYNMAVVPVYLDDYEGPQNDVCTMGFIVEMDYTGEPGGDDESGRYNTLYNFNRGCYFGISPSFADCTCSVPITAQKRPPYFASGAEKGMYPTGTTMYDYMSNIYIGANDPQINFDDVYGKFAIKYLHTALMTGNGAFSRTSKGEPQNPNPNPNYIPPTQNPTQEIVEMGVNRCDFYLVNNLAASPITYYEPSQLKTGLASQRKGFCSSQAGIGITGLSIGVSNTFNPFTPNKFKGTLLNKMGFELSQILSYGGQLDNQYNRGFERATCLVSSTIRNVWDYGVFPKTTNGYFTGTDMPFMVVNSADYDMANLGQIPYNQTVSTNTESDEIIAYNLAKKLDYPYLVVYSNIIGNKDYYGGKGGTSKVPAMCYITRNYAEGDFFYSFATSWNYVADQQYTLTDFETQIRRPDGTAANIGDNSSVIFRITKKQILPPDILDAEIQAANKNKKKS